MEPPVSEGVRLIFDISRRAPAAGELVVLRDGLGLVVKRVDAVSGSDLAEFRLTFANPVSEPGIRVCGSL